MQSDPPTPTRAPDNQFRQIQDQPDFVRNASLPNFWGWGRGILLHRWSPYSSDPDHLLLRREEPGASIYAVKQYLSLSIYIYIDMLEHLSLYIYIYACVYTYIYIYIYIGLGRPHSPDPDHLPSRREEPGCTS